MGVYGIIRGSTYFSFDGGGPCSYFDYLERCFDGREQMI